MQYNNNNNNNNNNNSNTVSTLWWGSPTSPWGILCTTFSCLACNLLLVPISFAVVMADLLIQAYFTEIFPFTAMHYATLGCTMLMSVMSIVPYRLVSFAVACWLLGIQTVLISYTLIISLCGSSKNLNINYGANYITFIALAILLVQVLLQGIISISFYHGMYMAYANNNNNNNVVPIGNTLVNNNTTNTIPNNTNNTTGKRTSVNFGANMTFSIDVNADDEQRAQEEECEVEMNTGNENECSYRNELDKTTRKAHSNFLFWRDLQVGAAITNFIQDTLIGVIFLTALCVIQQDDTPSMYMNNSDNTHSTTSILVSERMKSLQIACIVIHFSLYFTSLVSSVFTFITSVKTELPNNNTNNNNVLFRYITMPHPYLYGLSAFLHQILFIGLVAYTLLIHIGLNKIKSIYMPSNNNTTTSDTTSIGTVTSPLVCVLEHIELLVIYCALYKLVQFAISLGALLSQHRHLKCKKQLEVEPVA